MNAKGGSENTGDRRYSGLFDAPTERSAQPEIDHHLFDVELQRREKLDWLERLEEDLGRYVSQLRSRVSESVQNALTAVDRKLAPVYDRLDQYSPSVMKTGKTLALATALGGLSSAYVQSLGYRQDKEVLDSDAYKCATAAKSLDESWRNAGVDQSTPTYVDEVPASGYVAYGFSQLAYTSGCTLRSVTPFHRSLLKNPEDWNRGFTGGFGLGALTLTGLGAHRLLGRRREEELQENAVN